MQEQPEAVKQAVAEHIADLAGALRGRVWAWDVLNEPHTHQNLQRIVGYDQTAEWFRLARAADPQAQLVVNENNTIESGVKLDGFIKAIQILVDNQAPFDVIGLQGHFRASRFHPETNPLPTPQVWWDRLRQFAAFGKRLEITEFDVFNDSDNLAVRFNEADEARLTYEFMTLAFSHPQVDSFILWGFWTGAHWMNNAPIYRRDWTLKPSGEVFFNLVFHRWWTSVDGVTDANGRFETRGFLGDYEIEVRVGERTVKEPFRLTREANVVRLQL
jgi:GH35 family endo-1,4-beta-xylanase